MKAVVFAVLAVLCPACSSGSPDFRPCRVRCGDGEACPPAALCFPDGFCHREGDPQVCEVDASVGGDGSAAVDAGPDAPPDGEPDGTIDSRIDSTTDSTADSTTDARLPNDAPSLSCGNTACEVGEDCSTCPMDCCPTCLISGCQAPDCDYCPAQCSACMTGDGGVELPPDGPIS